MKIHQTIILLISAILILPFLGFFKVYEASEAREGIVVNEIITTQEFILPLRQGVIVPSKPLLFHWISTALSKFGSNYDEFFLRLPSALSAILLVLVVFMFASKKLGINFGYGSALILLSTYGFRTMAQDGRVDMLFCLLYTAALFSIFDYVIDPLKKISTKQTVLVGTLTGLAGLAKGPLAIVAVSIVVIAHTFIVSGISGLKRFLRPGFLLAFLIPGTWYSLASSKGSDGIIQRQIIFENISRFFGGSGISVKPFWFYLEHIWTQLAPWSAVLLFFLILKFFLKEQSSARDLEHEPTGDKKIIKLLWVWCVVIFIFISLSSGKRRAYLLTIIPPFSILASYYLCLAWSKLTAAKWGLKISHNLSKFYHNFALLWILVVLYLPLFFILSFQTSFSQEFSNHYLIKSLINIFDNNIYYFVLLGIFYAVFSILSFKLLRFGYRNKNGKALFLSVFLFFQLILTVYFNLGWAIKAENRSYKEFANLVRHSVPNDTQMFFIKKKKDESFEGFFFYYQKRIGIIEPKDFDFKPGTYVTRQEWFEKQELAFQKPMIIARGGKVKDPPQKRLVVFKIN